MKYTLNPLLSHTRVNGQQNRRIEITKQKYFIVALAGLKVVFHILTKKHLINPIYFYEL